jgi:hypothetical protein
LLGEWCGLLAKHPFWADNAMKWLHPRPYHVVVVFAAMGAFAALFAINSLNLLQLGQANYRFIAKFGWVALQEGALIQLLEIAASGFLSLAFYLGFKACEVELVTRWRSKTSGD